MAVYGNYKYITEFQGNPEKNKEFMEILKDLDQLCSLNTERVKLLVGYLDKMIPLLKSVNNVSKFKKVKDQIDGMVSEYNEWRDKEFKGVSGQVVWNRFIQKSKSFNNKYSELMMEEKKKINDKLDKLYDNVLKYIEPWSADKTTKHSKKVSEVLDQFKRLEEIDSTYTSSVAKRFDEFYKFAISEANYTIGDINYVKKKLDLGREKSLLYKAVNKILK